MAHRNYVVEVEETTLTDKVKAVLALAVPSISYPWWVIAVQGFIAALAAKFVTLPEPQQWLWKLILLDLATGLAKGVFVGGGWRARTMSWGATKKGFSLIVSSWAYQVPWKIEAMGMGFDTGSGITVWYMLGEAISIAENLDKLGLKLPPFVRPILATAREKMGAATLGEYADMAKKAKDSVS